MVEMSDEEANQGCGLWLVGDGPDGDNQLCSIKEALISFLSLKT